jgi:limonene-1,2-epoxide hydrolase
MKIMEKNFESTRNAKEVVMAFLKSMNDQDFKAARKYVIDDLSFVGVLGTRDSKEAYFKDMEQMRARYDIKKAFVDDNDVCVLYDISFGSSPASLFTCGWYHLQEGKISSIRVVFDPRPLLQQQK